MGRSKLEFKQCPDCPAGVLLPRSAFRENTKEKNGKKYSMVVARCRKHEAQHNNEYQTTKVESGICRRCSLPLAEGKTLCPIHLEAENKRTQSKRHEYKKSVVEFLGGKCLDCGLQTLFVSVYDFHHRDPNCKDFNITSKAQRSFDSIKSELLKCELLCANCHRIRHEKQELVR